MWISVKERLPGPFVPVVLLNINRRTHHTEFGDPMNLYYAAVGYLNNFPGPYWSIRAESATDIKAFTHWMPLPLPPKE